MAPILSDHVIQILLARLQRDPGSRTWCGAYFSGGVSQDTFPSAVALRLSTGAICELRTCIGRPGLGRRSTSLPACTAVGDGVGAAAAALGAAPGLAWEYGFHADEACSTGRTGRCHERDHHQLTGSGAPDREDRLLGAQR